MIEAKVKYGENSINMKFPCDNDYFDANLLKLGVADMTDTKLYISDISGCDELSFLKDNVVDIEELNSLMQRLDNFEEKDQKKFLAVIKEFDISNRNAEKSGVFECLMPCLTPSRLNKRQQGNRFRPHNCPMFTLTSCDIHGVYG